MLFRSFYPWSAQVWKPSYPPFLKGQPFNVSGEGLLEILRKIPSDLERRKNDYILSLLSPQANILPYLYLAGVWNKNPVSRESFILPPPKKLNGWMKVVCCETNSQSETRKGDGLVENKNGGRKPCVDLWATIKALKTTGSSIKTRLLSVQTYRTDLQEYLASCKRTLCQCCYWSVRTCIYILIIL